MVHFSNAYKKGTWSDSNVSSYALMLLETFAEYPKAKSYGFPLTIFYFSRRLHLTTEITIR